MDATKENVWIWILLTVPLILKTPVQSQCSFGFVLVCSWRITTTGPFGHFLSSLLKKKPVSLATLRASLAAVNFQIIFLEHCHLHQWLASALALFPAAQQPQIGAGPVCCWNPFRAWWLLSFEPTLKIENMLPSSSCTCKQTQWATTCFQDNHRSNTILNTPENLL